MLSFLKGRGFRQAIKQPLERFYERCLMDEDFAILSNNCWGYQLYQSLGRKYNTPFVGLYLIGGCYIKFISSLEFYLDCPIRFTRKSKYFSEDRSYPVGVMCDDIEIHFVHYEDEKECLLKWKRRKQRLQSYLNGSKPRIYSKMCDKDGSNQDVLENFHKITRFQKVSFSGKVLPYDSGLILDVSDTTREQGASRCNLIGPHLYSKRYRYFDMVVWIKYGVVKHTIWSRCLGLLA